MGKRRHTMAATPMEQYVVLVGNPGAGKSTLTNAAVGEIKTRSGVSFGRGVTYIDTVGLADVKARQQAAKDISRALSQDGLYKIVFVVSLEGGRVKAEDLETMGLVLESVSSPVPLTYGVIVNKVTDKIAAKLKPAVKAGLLRDLTIQGFSAPSVVYLPFVAELEDADNVLAPFRAELMEFLCTMSPVSITVQQVAAIKANKARKLREKQRQLAQEKAAREKAEKELAAQVAAAK